MKMITEQIYAAIGDLIKLLKDRDHLKLAEILEHRLYKVSWTSSTELLENVVYILEKSIGEHENVVDELVIKKKREIINAIKLNQTS